MAIMLIESPLIIKSSRSNGVTNSRRRLGIVEAYHADNYVI